MKQKYKMPFSSGGGRSAELELCYVCKNAVDLRCLEKCPHYANDYEDNQCTAFVGAEDTAKRISDALDIKCVTAK